jgi:hypothetical protein
MVPTTLPCNQFQVIVGYGAKKRRREDLAARIYKKLEGVARVG